MTESVADINEANGNGVAPQSHDDDWLRKVCCRQSVDTFGRRYGHCSSALKNSKAKPKIGNIAAFLNQAKFITRIIL